MSKGKLKQLNFNLPVEIFKEDNYFIAHTPALDMAVQGKTEAEVRDRFVKAVVIFFEELVDLGTTDDVLKELGWKKIQNNWQPPLSLVELRPIQVQVPA